jgi:conjugative relaxase-like TrwC/TraI family protein
MLRVTTIYASSAASAAAYYTKYLAESPGEVPGVWTGKQASALGLAGDVRGEDLQALLEGRDPVRGTPLGRPLTDRTRTDGTVVRAVAGFDATFSAPKSLSVLWALTQDRRLLEAHDVAVQAALAHLERYGATTRVRTLNGRLHPDTNGLTMAMFRQTTSRADDPQIHSHVVISAKVQTGDGRWLALDARYLKRYQRMLGGLYQSVLRNELTHRLGFGWEAIEHGQAEIVGVPGEVRDLFSKRSEQVDRSIADKRAEFVARQGRDPNQWELAAIKRQAAADTRSAKSGSGVTDLVTRWTAEAAAIGWTGPDLLAATIAAGVDQPTAAPTIDIDELIAALSTGGSAWHRANVVSAICDVARPNPNVDGHRWAGIVERVADEVIAGCVELDPADTAGPRRRSDGRSMWLEPSSAHITTDAILREEELVLTWALDRQADEPQPSATIDTVGLDVLQAAAAASAAGNDRLVLIVGPAGTGKTTTLRAAVDDLHGASRRVFGVAPSAKAARVLEQETGVPADTVAKLLHEWHRTDRAPHPRYQLPAGSTLLVDEAGMVGTPALARLAALATDRDWRVVLIGDPYQLQAVGRAGLFQELCVTGRAHELQRIHRFTEPWEAAASLMLRRGDPHAWDAYLDHGRVFAGTFEEHLATAAQRWLDTTARGGTVALVASTNEHVDALNAAIQRARVEHGQLDETATARIGGGERALIGDHVVTRRNDRHIPTSDGEPIRNRDQWTVTAVGRDGSLTVTSLRGHGRVVLPAEYVREHVRLGYAATEHGVQGATTTIGIELASTATTRRGAYVGVTRGRQENTVLVVTDSHDLDEARDILDRIITIDRADVPATTQRRELAALDRPPTHRPKPRCDIPEWLPELRATIADRLTDIEQRAAEHQQRRSTLADQLSSAEIELTDAQRRHAPHRPFLEAAYAAVRQAQERVWTVNHEATHGKGRTRRKAQREVKTAKLELTAARRRETDAKAAVAPTWNAVAEAITKVEAIRQSIATTHALEDWGAAPERIEQLHALRAAVDDWQHWADGQPLPSDRLTSMLSALRSDAAADLPGVEELGNAIEQRATVHAIGMGAGRTSSSLSFGIEL